MSPLLRWPPDSKGVYITPAASLVRVALRPTPRTPMVGPTGDPRLAQPWGGANARLMMAGPGSLGMAP